MPDTYKVTHPPRLFVAEPPRAYAGPRIDDNPASYGSKGQAWNAAFVEYMKAIETHPSYAAMPDAVKADGKIQWEAPSNRPPGIYQHTHHKRRDWWRRKAPEVGVDPNSDEWISRVAKTIHPTGRKPCKRCGLVLRIAYVYPGSSLVVRARTVLGGNLVPEALEEIEAFVRRVVDARGVKALDLLPRLLATGSITPPQLGRDLDAWLSWIERDYVRQEPSLLSPGVMSNAPDRFDGFHSFNRCCRGVADTGRHAENLRSYTTDRRVFEYWSEGDWIAADRMMGLVRARFSSHACADGGDGPPSADHVGPLSLGFTHRPEFRLLSKSANSAKNNRMTMWDVRFLLKREAMGEVVASWYAEPLWRLIKAKIGDEETALRASKLMRDNQRNAMAVLADLYAAGHFVFLASLLELHYADVHVEFEGLGVVDYVTTFSELVRTSRLTKYAVEQKARRVRIGFEALRAYSEKSNRHQYLVSTPKSKQSLQDAVRVLESTPTTGLGSELARLLKLPATEKAEEAMRAIASELPRLETVATFVEAREHLQRCMGFIANRLAALWEDERYVRAEFAFDD